VVVNQPVPVAKAAPVPEVKDWSEEVRDLQASIDHLYALGQQGKGGPMPFDRTSPGIVLPPGGSGTTRALFEDGTWKVVAPGDPWTYVKVSADFTTNSQSPVNVPGLSFTPAANQEYLVEAMLLIQSASTGSGTQPGVSWPTGLTDGAARIETTGASATGTVILNAPAGTAGSAAATGEPLAATSYPATVTATLITGPSVAGDFQITVKRS
jgi:hypothetical protein